MIGKLEKGIVDALLARITMASTKQPHDRVSMQRLNRLFKRLVVVPLVDAFSRKTFISPLQQSSKCEFFGSNAFNKLPSHRLVIWRSETKQPRDDESIIVSHGIFESAVDPQ